MSTPDRKCSYCPSTTGPWHRDHVVPFSRGGTEEPPNLVWSCAPCNQAKGAKLPSEWLADPPPEILAIEREVLASIDPSAPKRKRREPSPEKKKRNFERFHAKQLLSFVEGRMSDVQGRARAEGRDMTAEERKTFLDDTKMAIELTTYLAFIKNFPKDAVMAHMALLVEQKTGVIQGSLPSSIPRPTMTDRPSWEDDVDDVLRSLEKEGREPTREEGEFLDAALAYAVLFLQRDLEAAE